MTLNNATYDERRFDRAAWLTLTVVFSFVLVTLATTLAILNLPTDGWQIQYNSAPPPALTNFAGNWSTPLHAGDQVLAVNGVKVAGREGLTPITLAAWKTGQNVTYTILRDKQTIEIPVTLYRLNTTGLLRSFWFTVKDTPTEWSWSLIAVLLFFYRPRSSAARLMFLAFVPDNAVTKLAWAANTVSHNFAAGSIFFLHVFTTSFWGYLFFPAIILLALSFPQAIFPLTRWPRAVPLGLFGITLIFSIITIAAYSDLLITIILVGEAVLLILAFGAALANARKQTHNPVAQAQSLWVIFGFGVSSIPTLVGYLLTYSGILDLTSINWIYQYISILALPVCLAIAITRYHLFNIYVIIRRTLQYTLLTVLLALVYGIGVILLQFIFGLIIGAGARGQTQDIVIVLSTLAIAALFTPLRRSVQNFIDRRFFRGKFDAEQILANFAATARSEVAMEPLTHKLIKVVDETMQPEQMSVWIKRLG